MEVTGGRDWQLGRPTTPTKFAKDSRSESYSRAGVNVKSVKISNLVDVTQFYDRLKGGLLWCVRQAENRQNSE